MLTSYGFGVIARISLQLPVDEAKSFPILYTSPPTHAISELWKTNKQINKQKSKQDRGDGEASVKETPHYTF